MRRLFSLLAFFGIFVVSWFTLSGKVEAISCSGTITCCVSYVTVPTPEGCNPACTPGFPCDGYLCTGSEQKCDNAWETWGCVDEGFGCYPNIPSICKGDITANCQAATFCGDGSCNGLETCSSCPGDCHVGCSSCPDGFCDDAAGENSCTCNQDCGGTCSGLTECQMNGGTCMAAAADCGTYGMSTGSGACNAGDMCCTSNSGWSSCIPNYDNPPGCAKIGEGHYPPGHCSGDGSDCYWPTNCYEGPIFHGSDCIWDFTCCQGLDFGATTCQCPTPVCTPSCVVACGQDDGCGNACSSADAGTPNCATISTSTPYLNPATGLVTIDWTDNNLADLYNVIIYPQGTTQTCNLAVNPNAYCDTVSSKSYSFYPVVGLGNQYSISIQGINNTCGTDTGPACASNFTIYAPIQIEFHEDTDSSCSAVNPVIPGGGSTGSMSLTDGVGFNLNSPITDTTLTMYAPYWPTGNYNLTINPGVDAASGNDWTCICPRGCQYAGVSSPDGPIRFYVSKLDLTHSGWYQTVGGNIYAAQNWPGNAIIDPIPIITCGPNASCTTDIISKDLDTRDYSAGIAVTGGGSIDSSEDDGEQTGYITERGAQTRVVGNTLEKVTENYNFFAQQYNLGSNPEDNSADFGNPNSNAQKPSITRTHYYVPGNFKIKEPWTINKGESYVVFVGGNMIIDDEADYYKLIEVEEGGFLAFIVSGQINISENVGNGMLDFDNLESNIEGVFIADGHISIASKGKDAGGDERFIGEGIFVSWTDIILERDFDNDRIRKVENNIRPVEVFIYRPDFVFYAPDIMSKPRLLWQESN